MFFADVILFCFRKFFFFSFVLFALLYSRGRAESRGIINAGVLEFQRYVDFFWIIFEVFRSNLDNVIWIFWYFFTFNKVVCSDRNRIERRNGSFTCRFSRFFFVFIKYLVVSKMQYIFYYLKGAFLCFFYCCFLSEKKTKCNFYFRSN